MCVCVCARVCVCVCVCVCVSCNESLRERIMHVELFTCVDQLLKHCIIPTRMPFSISSLEIFCDKNELATC